MPSIPTTTTNSSTSFDSNLGFETTHDQSTSYQTFTSPIIKSDNDQRDYRIIKLNNQLQVILVHDPKADKAAAALSVNVGHLSDPPQLPGLAHFCEHLLFMGNKKYPSENEYSEYLAKHSGYSNAFTGMDDTVYYFEVHPSALDGALDRFAQFFISPLFTDSCTEREIRAVDSENSKNLQSDHWKLFQLDKHTSSHEHHSFWKFGTGNLQTLWDHPKSIGLNIRQELIDFHSKHYSSNLMTLAVSGTNSIEELTQMVLQHFSEIPNKQILPDQFHSSPYTSKELGKLIFTQLVKDNNLLEITFPLPDQDPFYDTQPTSFLSHYIGHEGIGSATSYLKKKGWVRTFQCGPGGGATGFDLFKITLDLTAEGLTHYKEVVQVIFAYLDLLRSTPPQEWSFREQAQLAEIRFRFKSQSAPGQYATSLATSLRKPCPRQSILSSSYLTNTFDPKLIQETMSLLKPELCRIVIGSQSGKFEDDIQLDLTEPWYATPYAIREFPKDLFDLEAINSIRQSGTLSLPPPNSFISTDFSVDKVDVPVPSRRPHCIRDDAYGRLWHKKDDRWWVPRASIVVMIRNPIIDQTCHNIIKSQYVTKLLKESLNEQLYESEIAGLSYNISYDSDSLVFNLDGYNQKLSVLFEHVLNGLKNLKVDRQKFELVKDFQIRRYQNFMLEGPVRIAAYWIEAALNDLHYGYEEKLKALEVITPEDVEAFIPELLKEGFVESLVHGNLTEKEAIEILELPTRILDLKPVKSSALRKSHSLSIPKGTNLIYERDLINPSNLNSAVNDFIDLGDITCHSTRTKLTLLSQLINEPAFNQLRTIEQLGYMVYTYLRRATGQIGLNITIQSERDPKFIESRIEHFLKWFGDVKLKEMSEEEFEDQKLSLINKLLEDFKNLWEEATHYWIHILSGYYAFEQRFKDAKMIKQITKSEIEEFYQTYINPSSSTRSKLSIQIKSQKVPVPNETIEGLGLKEQVGQKKIDFNELEGLLKELGMDEVKGKVDEEEVSEVKGLIVKDGIDGLRKRLEKTSCAIPHPDWKA
ncbi:putative a-pheromone processing metallopeptidase Ste23 [Melampsora americana]|nr:putative a-pheromone processing metallopeptidase Ste23 [Melampsora americana]